MYNIYNDTFLTSATFHGHIFYMNLQNNGEKTHNQTTTTTKIFRSTEYVN